MSFVEDPGQRLSHGPIAHPTPRRPREEVERVVGFLAFPGEPAGPGFRPRQAVAMAHEGNARRVRLELLRAQRAGRPREPDVAEDEVPRDRGVVHEDAKSRRAGVAGLVAPGADPHPVPRTAPPSAADVREVYRVVLAHERALRLVEEQRHRAFDEGILGLRARASGRVPPITFEAAGVDRLRVVAVLVVLNRGAEPAGSRTFRRTVHQRLRRCAARLRERRQDAGRALPDA